jgi:transglutaminase-like putative cysteine protease
VTTRYRVLHRTTYHYGEMMSRGHTVTHLVPRDGDGQVVEHRAVTADPYPEERIEFDDAFGNRVVQFVVATPHDRLAVHAECVVSVDDPVPPIDVTPWDTPVAWPPAVAGYCAASPFAAPTRAVRAFAEPCFTPGRSIVDSARELCRRIHTEFTFDPTFTEVATPLDEVLHARRGVCQDFAHLAVAALRAFGLPARYVSGYVETVPPPGEAKLVGADASHAWCAVALGDGSWLALDPTNDQVPPIRHVVVAYGRDYLDVAPVTGVVIGPPSDQYLVVEVDVSSD